MLADLAKDWFRKAHELQRFAPAAAEAFRECGTSLEAAIRDLNDESLTLEQASVASGYSVDHLSRMVREGRVANAGTKGRPRIRRADLPAKPGGLRASA